MPTRPSRTRRRVYTKAILAGLLAVSLLAGILSLPLWANAVLLLGL